MSRVNLDVSERLDITCRKGDTFSLTLTLKDSSGTGLTLVTDNYQFLMQVRSQSARRTPATVARRSSSDDSLVIGSKELGTTADVNFDFNNIDDSGNVTVFVSATDMRKVPSGKYVYDFQYVQAETQKTVLNGSFTVNEDISKSL
jgi:hypothetical protein